MLKVDESRITNQESRDHPFLVPLKVRRSWRGLLLLIVILVLFWHQKVIAPTLSSPLEGEAKQPLQKTTIIAVGDILLSRNVGAKIDQANNPNLPFEKVRDSLTNADITFGNLECPLSDSPIPIREGIVFRCLTKYVRGLRDAGFDILSTTNNHAFDQGEKNISFTVEYLRSQNILPVGTGVAYGDANTPRILEKNGTRFGFMGFSYSARNDGGHSKHPQISTMDDPPLVQEQIRIAKNSETLPLDVLIVSIHAGTEYTRNPTQLQINFARAAIDAGADVVIGHHPHWIQTVEIYENRPIFYSLGNFVFDQSWSEETKEGLMVELTFTDRKLESVKLIPVIIENNCCPRLVTEQEKLKILRKINLDTDTFNFPALEGLKD